MTVYPCNLNGGLSYDEEDSRRPGRASDSRHIGLCTVDVRGHAEERPSLRGPGHQRLRSHKDFGIRHDRSRCHRIHAHQDGRKGAVLQERGHQPHLRDRFQDTHGDRFRNPACLRALHSGRLGKVPLEGSLVQPQLPDLQHLHEREHLPVHDHLPGSIAFRGPAVHTRGLLHRQRVQPHAHGGQVHLRRGSLALCPQEP